MKTAVQIASTILIAITGSLSLGVTAQAADRSRTLRAAQTAAATEQEQVYNDYKIHVKANMKREPASLAPEQTEDVDLKVVWMNNR